MAPSADDVRRQLDRLLASTVFANAGRMSRFLKFVVEQTLAGEGERLKEYVIGVEVFDRDANYDPRLDAIVRVEAARLRTKLAEYYAGEGRSDAVVLSLPKGGYAPVVTPADAPPPRRTARRQRQSVATAPRSDPPPLRRTAWPRGWLRGRVARRRRRASGGHLGAVGQRRQTPRSESPCCRSPPTPTIRRREWHAVGGSYCRRGSAHRPSTLGLATTSAARRCAPCRLRLWRWQPGRRGLRRHRLDSGSGCCHSLLTPVTPALNPRPWQCD